MSIRESLDKVFRSVKRKLINHKVEISFPDIAIKREDISKILMKYPYAKIFIETGTFWGDTIEYFKNDFNKLYSIELSTELAEKAKIRFQNDPYITIVQGNSSKELANILSGLDSPCLFWLDGHYSSEFWVGKEYIKTAKGDKNTPILEELSQIKKHQIKNHVILIDDARLFTGENDYPSGRKLKSFVSKKFPKHSFEIENDIIRILPKNI